MISPYVPVALSIFGAISAILSIALSWVSLTVKVNGLEIKYEPITLLSELGQDLDGAFATLVFLFAALVFHVGATGMGFFYAKSPESGKFWGVAIAEVVAAVSLLIAGIIWGVNIGDNIDQVKFFVALLSPKNVFPRVEFLLFSVGQGFGITSFLFAVAAAITAFNVHKANKDGSMQVQALGLAAGAKPSWGGPVVAYPYGQPQQPQQQMQQMQMQQMPQMQMQQMQQTQQGRQPWA
jgi:hypothetical protein